MQYMTNYIYCYKYFFKSAFLLSANYKLVMNAVIKIHCNSLRTTPTKSPVCVPVNDKMTAVIQGASYKLGSMMSYARSHRSRK